MTQAKTSRGRPFRPGQSGNPKGRPPTEVCLTNLLRAALAERDVDGKRTKARALIDSLVLQACEGNVRAIEQIFARIDGILQPILQGPAVDLEAVALAMRDKREKLGSGDASGSAA